MEVTGLNRARHNSRNHQGQTGSVALETRALAVRSFAKENLYKTCMKAKQATQRMPNRP
jgi:hypothetical protein